jgi:hypothetical protein
MRAVGAIRLFLELDILVEDERAVVIGLGSGGEVEEDVACRALDGSCPRSSGECSPAC